MFAGELNFIYFIFFLYSCCIFCRNTGVVVSRENCYVICRNQYGYVLVYVVVNLRCTYARCFCLSNDPYVNKVSTVKLRYTIPLASISRAYSVY